MQVKTMTKSNLIQCVIKPLAAAIAVASLAACGGVGDSDEPTSTVSSTVSSSPEVISSTPEQSSSSSEPTVESSSETVESSSQAVSVSSETTESSSETVQSSSPASESSSVAAESSSAPAATSNALFSDNFDEGTALGSIWSEAGSVEISSERAFSGDNSLKFSAEGNGYNRNFITLNLDGTPAATDMYGRMMIWIDTPNGNGGDFSFIQGEGFPKSDVGAPEETMVMYRYRVDGQNRNGTLMANYDTWIDANDDGQTDWLTDCWDHSDTQLPRETWSCVEWHFNAENDVMEFWLDGQEISEISVNQAGEGCINTDNQGGMWTAPAQFDRVHVGIEQYHSGVPARTVFIDDVEVGTEQIGCP